MRFRQLRVQRFRESRDLHLSCRDRGGGSGALMKSVNNTLSGLEVDMLSIYSQIRSAGIRIALLHYALSRLEIRMLKLADFPSDS